MIIGITGGIASGKSTVSNLLKQHGFEVIDADQISYNALTIDENCINKVLELFDCADDQNNIDRKKLGNIIFNDEIKQKQLEAIVHPYVINQIKEGIKKSENEIIFLDIPLLYEANLDSLCDYVVVVYVNKDTQLERLLKRNPLTKEEAIARINAQMSLEEKKQKANYIIDNENSLEDLINQVEIFIKNLNQGGVRWNNF